jgi:hypothetical protein
MTNGATEDVLKRSVTRGDYPDNPRGGGVMHFMVPAPMSAGPDLPAFWSFARDQVLFSTLYRESVWASAISLAISKIVSQGYDIKSEVPLRARRAQQLFLNMDNGRGSVGGLQRHLQAYLLAGNGGPVEIVRATPAAGSRILGLVPLDTLRTTRTGDPDFPLLYRDRKGREHVLRDYQAFILSDMPDQADTWYGVGHCAAERAYKAVCKLEAIENYLFEKVSGKRALALDFISGVMDQQIKDSKSAAEAEKTAKGVIHYMGSVIIALMGDTAPQHVRINLAELPDGFARKEEFDICLLTFARAIGIPVQDLQPLSGQGLGTGAQTQVLDEAAKGQGLSAWRKAFEHAVNENVLDETTTFTFITDDMRDRERAAKVRIDEAAAISTWHAIGLPAEYCVQLGVDRDQLPREFLDIDLTPAETLSDTEKPVDGEDGPGVQMDDEEKPPAEREEKPQPPQSKAIHLADDPAPHVLLPEAEYKALADRLARDDALRTMMGNLTRAVGEIKAREETRFEELAPVFETMFAELDAAQKSGESLAAVVSRLVAETTERKAQGAEALAALRRVMVEAQRQTQLKAIDTT